MADERLVIDAGFLELVRLGIKRADDQLIVESLVLVDQLIKVETLNGKAGIATTTTLMEKNVMAVNFVMAATAVDAFGLFLRANAANTMSHAETLRRPVCAWMG
jgi:hypothetical protein